MATNARSETDLAALLEHAQGVDADLKAMTDVLGDCRDVIREGLTHVSEQSHEGLQRIEALHRLLQPTPTVWGRWGKVALGLVLGVGITLGAEALYPQPQGVYVALMRSVDAVLVQAYATLPKGVQEQLSDTYKRYQVVPPDKRQKESK